MNDGLKFFAFVVVSGVIASAVLDAKIAHPAVVFVVWLITFVWGTGYIAGSVRDADSLVKMWLLSLAIAGVIGGGLALAFS